jgi:3-oxoacyl-[acyl-carrier-protein] synthase-3
METGTHALQSSRAALRLLGVGIGLPEKRISNETLAHLANVDPDWTERALGIKERRIVEFGEMTSDLAAQAARDAIAHAGVQASSIDLVILATMTPDRQIPSTACIVQQKLGLEHVPAFDIAAACSGFLYSITVAAQFLSNGAAKRALVIGADTLSTVTDWRSRDCVFFGDGAGAVIVERSEGSRGFFASRLAASPSGLENFTIPRGSSYFQMDRDGVYTSARRLITGLARQVLDDAGISIETVGRIIPHQASIKLLKTIAADLGADISKFKLNMDRIGNTGAATVPIALHDAYTAGEVEQDLWLLFLAAGAGMTGGAAVFRWH